MALEFSKLPKAVRGALVCLKSDSKGSKVDSCSQSFVFQYNPEMLTHTFSTPNCQEAVRQEEKRSGASKIVELINLNLELDAADRFEGPDVPEAAEYGLHPALAAMESIMLSQSETENSARTIVLFVWGPSRLIPVSLESVKILEEAFNDHLNPVRAKIELVMRVLDLSEFRKGSLGYILCLSQLNRRELFIQKIVDSKVYRDFSKQVSRNIKRAL